MQKVFSNTDDSKVPLPERELYDLRLDDSDDIWRPEYVMTQLLAIRWRSE
jgi:hypothetical protein